MPLCGSWNYSDIEKDGHRWPLDQSKLEEIKILLMIIFSSSISSSLSSSSSLLLLSFFIAVDTSCPGISFEKVGCYKDAHRKTQRPLPDYLFNDRDSSIQNWSGKWIDWRNWDVYVPQFACRCAHAAKAKNFTYFGMQFYGKFQLVKRVNMHFKCRL